MFYEDPDFNGGLGGNPDDSKEEAAWDEAQSRFKQHKNNEKALQVGINQNKADEAKDDRKSFIRRKLLGKQQNPFAIATAKAKDMGYSDFSEGSEGNTKRGEIAEAIKEQKMKKQYEDLEEKWDKKPKHRGDWREAGHSTGRKKEAERLKRGFGPDKPFKKDDAVKHKEIINMNTEMVVNSVLKDLVSKGIIKSKGLEKVIPSLNKAEMSIPAIAGLVGAGAMLAKVFRLEDDGDDEHISKQVISYMEKNEDFFDGVGKMCEFICSLKDGEEPTDEGRGERLIEAASSFHKACAVGAPAMSSTPGSYGEG